VTSRLWVIWKSRMRIEKEGIRFENMQRRVAVRENCGSAT
jgi:hypothetical protein